MATSIGHAPAAGLIDPAAGSVLSIAEALTNIIWAPLSRQTYECFTFSQLDVAMQKPG